MRLALDSDGAVFGEADAAHLPACAGREEIAVSRPAVAGGRQAGTAAQDVLVHHELAVVFANCPCWPEIAGVGRIARLGPLPRLAEQLLQAGLVAGAIALPNTTDGFAVKKSVFSGKAFANININSAVKVIAINPNSYKTVTGDGIVLHCDQLPPDYRDGSVFLSLP